MYALIKARNSNAMHLLHIVTPNPSAGIAISEQPRPQVYKC